MCSVGQIFALLILISGRADLTHKEHLLSEMVHLDVEEITVQRMFIMNALFLSVSATIGLFSFYYQKYSLFLSVSGNPLCLTCLLPIVH